VLLLVDLDGVVYRGREAVPGIPELLRARVRAGDTVIYCTNNSRLHRSEYRERLEAIGAPVDDAHILTSARATALALLDGPPPRAVMVVGGEGLARELRDVGLRVVAPTERGLAARPDVVVAGIDLALTHRRISLGADAIRAGARFVATNRDPVYPAPGGLVAGAGATVAALEVVSGRAPDLVVGKPEGRLFEEAARLAGVPVAQAVVIGDSLATDVRAARALGSRSVLMLTGVTSRAQLEAAAPESRPDAVAEDAAELTAILQRWGS
jgi:HAD superfamily hydrolase (TIGR01450 family)